MFASGETYGTQRFGLVALAVTKKTPHARIGRVVNFAMVEVTIESRVIDRVDWSKPHRHGGEFPKVIHQPRVWVTGESVSGDLAAKIGQVLFVKTSLEECARIDARRCVTLEVDVVSCLAVILTTKEVIESQFVESRRRSVRREVSTNPVGVVIGVDDHDRRVPADIGADPSLDVNVAREPRLGGRRDRIDVGR